MEEDPEDKRITYPSAHFVVLRRRLLLVAEIIWRESKCLAALEFEPLLRRVYAFTSFCVRPERPLVLHERLPQLQQLGVLLGVDPPQVLHMLDHHLHCFTDAALLKVRRVNSGESHNSPGCGASVEEERVHVNSPTW